MTPPTEPRADDPAALVITEAQLAELTWLSEIYKPSGNRVDQMQAALVEALAAYRAVAEALRAAREPLRDAVVEAAVTAVTTWRAMHDDESRGVDHWWDAYVGHRDALIDAVDAYLAQEPPR